MKESGAFDIYFFTNQAGVKTVGASSTRLAGAEPAWKVDDEGRGGLGGEGSMRVAVIGST
jgi:hypothetical protein